jgi:hypothetical protein
MQREQLETRPARRPGFPTVLVQHDGSDKLHWVQTQVTDQQVAVIIIFDSLAKSAGSAIT